MKITVDSGDRHDHVNVVTGGVDPADPSRSQHPVVVLVHGAGMDASAWQLQTRYLAHHGYRALAVDLPGHGRTPGPPLDDIGAMAAFLGAFLRSVDRELGGALPAHVVGHSMGTFVGLELAAAAPDLVRSLVLLGTADAMPVHPQLLSDAADDLPAAAALMAAWGHDRTAHVGANPTPGQWLLGGARALVEGSAAGSLASDFAACAAYGGATAAASSVRCPVTVAVGLGDKMTPPRSAARLIEALGTPHVVELADTGHMLMTENPKAVRALLIDALGATE